MSTYTTYPAAKIANPDSPARPGEKWELCNPADYCMTVKQFFDAGHKFVEGDMYVTEGAITPVNVGTDWGVEQCNEPHDDDDNCYVIKAKALEETNTIPTETQEEKEALDAIEKTYRYEKVTDSIFDLKEEFERGELYFAWLGNPEPVSNSVGYDKITDEKMLLCRYEEKRILRRIEVTERELFIDAYASAFNTHMLLVEDVAGTLFDSGKFKLVNGEG